MISELIPDEEIRVEVQHSIQALEQQIGKNLFLPNSIQKKIIEHISGSHRNNSEFGNESEINLDLPHNVEDEECLENFTWCFEKQWKAFPMDDAIIEEYVMWTFWNSFFFSFTAITTIGKH